MIRSKNYSLFPREGTRGWVDCDERPSHESDARSKNAPPPWSQIIPHGSHTSESKHAHAHDENEQAHFGPGSEETLGRSDQFNKNIDREIIEWLPVSAGGSALDAGCGAAGVTELLARKVGKNGTTDAVDTSGHLIEHNKSRLADDETGQRIRFHESSIEKLPFENHTFDLVWSSRAVHHVSNPLAGIKELVRVLKPSGTLAIREGGLPARFLPDTTTLTGTGLNERIAEAGKKWMAEHVHFEEERTPYPFGWIQMLRDAGLPNVSARTFIHELIPPFNDEQQTHMLNNLSHWVNDDRKELLSSADQSAISRLIDPSDPEYAMNRPDLHYLEGITIYTGKA